jgi:2-keto-4-pentenoate hydratase
MLRSAAKLLVDARVAGSSALIASTHETLAAVKNIADGYDVLDEMMDMSKSANFALGPMIGWKIGATNAAAQAAVGFGPFYGPLFQSNIVVGSNPMVSMQATGILRAVEAELLFTMAEDMPPLPGGDVYSVTDTWSRVKSITPAIEVASTRINGGLTPASIVADFALNGCVVLGSSSYQPVPGNNYELLSQVTTTIDVNNSPVTNGDCSSVLGNPVIALTWLANELNKSNKMLSAGQIVMTGAIILTKSVAAFDTVTVRFGGFRETGIVEPVDAADDGIADEVSMVLSE